MTELKDVGVYILYITTDEDGSHIEHVASSKEKMIDYLTRHYKNISRDEFNQHVTLHVEKAYVDNDGMFNVIMILDPYDVEDEYMCEDGTLKNFNDNPQNPEDCPYYKYFKKTLSYILEHWTE